MATRAAAPPLVGGTEVSVTPKIPDLGHDGLRVEFGVPTKPDLDPRCHLLALLIIHDRRIGGDGKRYVLQI